MKIDADVFDFTKDITEKMYEADFCVSRAGASTLFELCANNLPTFFVPFKYAASNHQYYNAKALLEKNRPKLTSSEQIEHLKKKVSSFLFHLRKKPRNICRKTIIISNSGHIGKVLKNILSEKKQTHT